MEGLYRPYSPRRDGLGRYLPCFCLKIPTGGGKTFLAVKTIDLINTNYLKRRTGLVLWVVPTTQIYAQTIKGLRDRDHPYRQHLDIASGGRTVIREKADHFTPQDVRESLVVLMLMLPSANRKTRKYLRLLRRQRRIRGLLSGRGRHPRDGPTHRAGTEPGHLRIGECLLGQANQDFARQHAAFAESDPHSG